MVANKSILEKNLSNLSSNLSRFAYSLTSNKADAEDLVQDTLMKLLSNNTNYAEQGNFKGWAFTVMRNIFINNYRKLSNFKKVDNEVSPLENLAVYSDTTADTLVNVEEIDRLIDTFPTELSMPFRLYVNGYAYQEIADKMGIPLGTVKSRIFSARKKLKELIER